MFNVVDDVRDQYEYNIERMLNQIGDKGKCRGCGADIWWLVHKNGKRAPYTCKAENHFIDCPKADQFRRDRNAKSTEKR